MQCLGRLLLETKSPDFLFIPLSFLLVPLLVLSRQNPSFCFVSGLAGLTPSHSAATSLSRDALSVRSCVSGVCILRKLRSPARCCSPWTVPKREVPPACLLGTRHWFISLLPWAAKLAQFPGFSAKLHRVNKDDGKYVWSSPELGDRKQYLLHWVLRDLNFKLSSLSLCK